MKTRLAFSEHRNVEKDNSADASAYSSQFKALFQLWLRFDEAQASMRGEESVDQCTKVQSVIMTLMEATPSQTMEDLLYKLAIWRWDSLEPDIETADRGDRLAYSALADLARMTSNDWILTRCGEAEVGR